MRLPALDAGLDEVRRGEGDVVGRAVVFGVTLTSCLSKWISKWISRSRGLQHVVWACTYVLDLGPCESGECIGSVRGGHKACLSEVVLGLEVADLGLVWPVYNTHGDGEDGVALVKLLARGKASRASEKKPYLSLLSDGFVNDIMILDNLLLHCVLQILKTRILLL